MEWSHIQRLLGRTNSQNMSNKCSPSASLIKVREFWKFYCNNCFDIYRIDAGHTRRYGKMAQSSWRRCLLQTSWRFPASR